MATEPISPSVVEVICQGDSREMGFAQGAGAKNKIHGAHQALIELEAFRLLQPRLLPYPVYRWLAEKKAAQFLAGLEKHYPDMNHRLAGIAAGAGIALNAIYLVNALEPLLSSVGGCTTCPGACSAIAIRGARSTTGEPILARNFDYLPLVQPFYLVRESRPKAKLRAFEFTTAPLAGAVDGMNEKGLCITYNYGFTIDTPLASAAPLSMVISETLQNCGTVAQAAEWLASKPRYGGGLLMLCDATGDIASLELSSTRSHLRRPTSGTDTLFHTNAFSSDHMREVQAPWDSVYTNNAPTPLRGKRLHQSSELRDQRFQELLEKADTLDIEQLGAIMADHGPTGTPNGDTPCMHSPYWYTTACLQFFPKSRSIRVAYNTACQAHYQEIQL